MNLVKRYEFQDLAKEIGMEEALDALSVLLHQEALALARQSVVVSEMVRSIAENVEQASMDYYVSTK